MTHRVSQEKERRKYPRYKVQTDLFVLHADFGQVVDIGMGGMVFTYIECRNPNRYRPKIGVLFSRDDDYLVELPLRTLSDRMHQKASCGKPPIRRRTVVFGGLSALQRKRLENFIRQNISGPAPPDTLCSK